MSLTNNQCPQYCVFLWLKQIMLHVSVYVADNSGKLFDAVTKMSVSLANLYTDVFKNLEYIGMYICCMAIFTTLKKKKNKS